MKFGECRVCWKMCAKSSTLGSDLDVGLTLQRSGDQISANCVALACDIIIACSLSLYLDWLHVSQHRRITSTCPSEQYNRRRSWRTSKQEKTHKVILCRFCCFRCLEQFYTDAILLPLLFHCLWLDGILIVTVHSSLAVVLPLRPLS